MNTNKTVNAVAWFDTTHTPAAWAVRYTSTEDTSDQLDDILAEPEQLGAAASQADVEARVQAHAAAHRLTVESISVE